MAIKGVIRAVAPDPTKNLSARVDLTPGSQPPRSNISAVSIPLLNDESTGVLGIPSLQLGPNGALTSAAKEVKLEPGMQITLEITLVH